MYLNTHREHIKMELKGTVAKGMDFQYTRTPVWFKAVLTQWKCLGKVADH